MLKILLMAILGLMTPLSAIEPESEKQQVSERLQEVAKAVNQGNLDLLSSFWSEDAELVKPAIGEVIEGKADIMKYLQTQADEIKKRGLQFAFKPNRIDFPDEKQAIVTGVVEITHKGALLQRLARRVELDKDDDGQWYIDIVRDVEVPPPPPVYEHLKQLEWLVGNWMDADEDVTITFKTTWDKFKNFMSQHFNMKVYGMEDIEGTQIIGWDPIEQKIRSWVFDSDGGYGTGLWTGKDDSWQARMHYTLSDGKKATATNIYTKINNESYRYSSFDRTMNGEKLPDVNPVTIVKEE